MVAIGCEYSHGYDRYPDSVLALVQMWTENPSVRKRSRRVKTILNPIHRDPPPLPSTVTNIVSCGFYQELPQEFASKLRLVGACSMTAGLLVILVALIGPSDVEYMDWRHVTGFLMKIDNLRITWAWQSMILLWLQAVKLLICGDKLQRKHLIVFLVIMSVFE